MSTTICRDFHKDMMTLPSQQSRTGLSLDEQIAECEAKWPRTHYCVWRGLLMILSLAMSLLLFWMAIVAAFALSPLALLWWSLASVFFAIPVGQILKHNNS